jgi:hypothetical protein
MHKYAWHYRFCIVDVLTLKRVFHFRDGRLSRDVFDDSPEQAAVLRLSAPFMDREDWGG